MERRKGWYSGLAGGCLAVAIGLFACGGGGDIAEPGSLSAAVLALPAAQADRDKVVGYLKKLCRGAEIQVTESPMGSGMFKLMVGAVDPMSKTPKGCKLLKDIAMSMKTVTISVDETTKATAGSTSGTDPGRGDGNGSDSTISFPVNSWNDGDIIVYQGTEKEGDTPTNPYPPEIGLGHELIHAGHNAAGNREPGNAEGQTIDGSGAGNHDTTENDLRDEQNKANGKMMGDAGFLPPRHGHCGANK